MRTDAMILLFQVLVHVVLATAALCQLLLIGAVIGKFRTERHKQEVIMRSAAAVCGLLLYLGAKPLGFSIPEFIFHALSQSISYSIGVVGVILPSLTGILVAWYVVRYFNSANERKNIVGMRLLTLIMTMVFFLYTDAYVANFDPSQHDGVKLLLPNLTFVLSVLLYAVFKYHPLEEPEPVAPVLAAVQDAAE